MTGMLWSFANWKGRREWVAPMSKIARMGSVDFDVDSEQGMCCKWFAVVWRNGLVLVL